MSEEKRSSTGLESNVGGLLSYVLGWVTGLIFILIEQEDEFIRYHAMQSIFVFGGISVLAFVLWLLALIPVIGILFLVLQWLVAVGAFVLWILLMVRAYQGERYKLPWTGELAERYSAKR